MDETFFKNLSIEATTIFKYKADHVILITHNYLNHSHARDNTFTCLYLQQSDQPHHLEFQPQLHPCTMENEKNPKSKTALKHVSLACIECRTKHLKCSGDLPKCKRCEKMKRECTYVKSRRGGSRKKGLTKTTCASSSDCIGACVRAGVPDGSLDLPCNGKRKKDLHVELFPLFNSSRSSVIPNLVSDVVSAPSILPQLTKDINLPKVIDDYYATFHYIHPFLPHREDIYSYITSIPHHYDLVLAMKLMGEGQATGVYAKDVETVNFKVNHILNYVKQMQPDFVSLQSLLLLSIVSHISSLHDLSAAIRTQCVNLVFAFELNMLDRNDQSVSLLQSQSRLFNVDFSKIPDCARRTFWEVFFFDTVSGTADGRTISRLFLSQDFPEYPSFGNFDFKSRAEACRLVNESIKLNVAIENGAPFSKQFSLLEGKIASWKFGACDNEGGHQALIMFNYARIFVYRPFSYFWQAEGSKNSAKQTAMTRNTIEGANSIARLLIQTGPDFITKRTPMFACALAFASLLHISAYSWCASWDGPKEELDLYVDYIRLELQGLESISKNWALSGKLWTHVMETLLKLTPDIYHRIQKPGNDVQIEMDQENADLFDFGAETGCDWVDKNFFDLFDFDSELNPLF